MGPCLLLIGADALARHALADTLRATGPFSLVVDAATPPDGLAALAGRPPAVIVLDIPPTDDDQDGRAALAALRDLGLHAPVVRLLAAAPRVASAAADVVVKPLRLADLLARLDAARTAVVVPPSPDQPLGSLVFSPDTRTLATPDGATRTRLTDKEAQLLLALAQNTGRIVPRETLLHEVWGYGEAIDTHTLETHVYRLRRKLEDAGLHDLGLLTEEGGYGLVALPSRPTPTRPTPAGPNPAGPNPTGPADA